jgi:hypothetical protein
MSAPLRDPARPRPIWPYDKVPYFVFEHDAEIVVPELALSQYGPIANDLFQARYDLGSYR